MKPTKSKKTKTQQACCEPDSHSSHPDYSDFLPKLNRAQGQLTGIQRMITEGRYCVDILVQFRAAMAALRAIEVSVFERHLKHCISSALLSQDKNEVDQKIKELTELLSRRSSI